MSGDLVSVVAESIFSRENIGLYAAIIIFSIQFIIILYLVVNQKSGGSKYEVPNELIAENKRLAEENASMYSRVDAMKKNIVDLKGANLDLMAQKDALLQSKAQLEDLQAKKIELIEMAIHDIKNPAAAIRGYIELLESYDLNAVEQNSIIHSLFEISSQIIDITKEMTELMEKNKTVIELNIRKISVSEIITNVIRKNQGYAKTKEITLQQNIPADIPEIEADRTKIQEVIENLVNNAIKYGPKGTIVKLKASQHDSRLNIEVSDDGFGLSAEDIDNAFKKGSVLSTEPTGGETRSGLGLWIVKRIIEEHGGSVKVRSNVGKGSVFSFTLPFEQKRRKY